MKEEGASYTGGRAFQSNQSYGLGTAGKISEAMWLKWDKPKEIKS